MILLLLFWQVHSSVFFGDLYIFVAYRERICIKWIIEIMLYKWWSSPHPCYHNVFFFNY